MTDRAKRKLRFPSQMAAFFIRDLQIWVSYRLSLFLDIVGLVGTALAFFLLGLAFEGYIPPMLEQYGGYFPFVIIGIAFFGFQSNGLYGLSGSLREEQLQGTLEPMLSSRITPLSLSLATNTFSFLRTLVRAVLFLVLGALVFSVDLSSMNIPSAIVVLALSLPPFLALGMLSGAFTLAFKRGDPVRLVYGGLSVLLSGLYFPYQLLPQPLQWLAHAFPLTHALSGLRAALLNGASFSEVSTQIIWLLGMGVVLLPLGIVALKLGHRKARRDGSYAQY